MAKMFGGKKQTPQMPQAPAPMPDPESAEVVSAKKRETEAAMQRAGRASTILTGGDSYGNSKLGA